MGASKQAHFYVHPRTAPARVQVEWLHAGTRGTSPFSVPRHRPLGGVGRDLENGGVRDLGLHGFADHVGDVQLDEFVIFLPPFMRGHGAHLYLITDHQALPESDLRADVNPRRQHEAVRERRVRLAQDQVRVDDTGSVELQVQRSKDPYKILIDL